MIKSVTKEEAQQALKTIAQYCDDVDCYECDIKDACEKLEIKEYPFFFLAEWMRKKT